MNVKNEVRNQNLCLVHDKTADQSMNDISTCKIFNVLSVVSLQENPRLALAVHGGGLL